MNVSVLGDTLPGSLSETSGSVSVVFLPSLGDLYLFGFETGSHFMAHAGLRFKGAGNLLASTFQGARTRAVVMQPGSVYLLHCSQVTRLSAAPC